MDKLKTLKKLEELKELIDNERGFRTKREFLSWGAKVEPLLGFNLRYQAEFATDLGMLHVKLSSRTGGPLADRLRTSLEKAIEQLKHEIETTDQPEPIKLSTQTKEYVHQDRISELREIPSDKFDLCKLIRFCEELNSCYREKDCISIILLTRALIDHVPPVFGFRTFNEVVSSYKGTSSFKESMKNLNSSSRKIADQHLHTAIRKSESIPTMNQVDFSNDIDVLLAEIHRILKEE